MEGRKTKLTRPEGRKTEGRIVVRLENGLQNVELDGHRKTVVRN
jgi:hypothetical protein